MDIKEKVRDYIGKNLITFEGDVVYTDDDNIFKKGIVNSLFAMKLLTYVEDEFTIVVENDEMEMSNFNSVNNIVNFINKKLAAK